MLVPLFTMLGDFTEHEAIPLSIATVFGASMFSTLGSYVWQRHPLVPHRPMIAYDATIVLLPATLLGSTAGARKSHRALLPRAATARCHRIPRCTGIVRARGAVLPRTHASRTRRLRQREHARARARMRPRVIVRRRATVRWRARRLSEQGVSELDDCGTARGPLRLLWQADS